MEKIHADSLIIGFGKGGKTLAATLAKRGAKVILVEQSELMYGGTCINIGCIPSKSMVLSAEKNIPYPAAVDNKNNLTAFLRTRNFQDVDNGNNARVITGKASFLNSHEVQVHTKDGAEYIITGDKIFINTGAAPDKPAIEGIDGSKRVYNSTTLMEEKKLPPRLTIIGAGYVALEFASMYAKYGSEVTILDRSSSFLPKEDEDIAAEIESLLTKKKIRILKNTAVSRIEPGPGSDRIYFTAGDKSSQATGSAPQYLETDAILLATGRNPVTEGLGLDLAGVATDPKGFIKVDEWLKTNVPHIWALGDVNGGPQFTYIALDDYRIVLDQLVGESKRKTTDRASVAFAVFMTPVFAHVGLREKEARKQGYRVTIKSVKAAAIPKARILNETDGLLKMIVDADTGLVLGCSLLCAEAHEIINLVRMGMTNGVPFSALRNGIYTHPSMSEALNYFPQ